MPLYFFGEENNLSAQERVKSPSAQHSKFIYRDLEEELEFFLRMVPPVDAHLNVYSTKLWSLIVRASSEIDSQLHSLVVELDSSLKNKRTSFSVFQKYETQLQLRSYGVNLSFNGRRLVPFDEKLRGGKPEWWIGYNEVKHRRLDTLESASLDHALLAVAGLYIVLFRQFGDYLMPPPLTLIGVQMHQQSPSRVFGRVGPNA